MKVKIAVCIALAVLLQSSLGGIWRPLVNGQLPLVVVVYFALRRNIVQALMIGAVTGLATDAMSRGLLGASGFSMTLTAYLIAAISNRVMLDNPLARIPVLAGATAFNMVIFVSLNRLLGQIPSVPLAETAAFTLIGTTVAGTAIFFLLDIFFSAGQRRQFAFRRRAARRSFRPNRSTSKRFVL